MENKRVVYFDYLRIIAVFAVVVIHVAAKNWKTAGVDTFAWQMFNLYDGMVVWAVPVFVMISGALFLGKEQPLKKLYGRNILRIVTTFIFWSILYAVWDCFGITNNFTAKIFFTRIINGHYHMWFLFMIIGLYVVTPFLNRVVEDKKIACYFVALALIFAFLFTQSKEIIALKNTSLSNQIDKYINKFGINMVLGYSGYFVFGYLLNEAEIKKKQEIVIYTLGIVALAFTIVATSAVSLKLNVPVKAIYEKLTVNTFLASVAVFTFAKQHLNKPVKTEKGRRILFFISKCSFGVYLIHPFFIECFIIFLNFTTLSFNAALSVPVITVISFILSLAVSVVLNKTPVLKKWVV